MIPLVRVTINGRFLTRPISGVERVAHEVVMALAGCDGLALDIAMPACADPGPALDFAAQTGLAMRFGRLKGHLWEQLELPWQSRGRLLVSPCNTGPVVKSQQVVVIHDAQTFDIPETFSPAFRRFYQILLPRLGRRARQVITVSDYSKSRLAAVGVRADAQVIPNAVNHFAQITPDTDICPSGPFVLALGSSAPHKNFDFICDIFSSTPGLPPLYVAGGHASGVFARDTAGSVCNVHFLGRVSDGQLAGLYSQAQAFLFPSLYEGFGIPPLEAMWWGCPVLASNTTSMPQACGQAAVLLDPTDKTAWVQALRGLLADPDQQQVLRAAGHKQARKVTWADVAGAYAIALRGAA